MLNKGLAADAISEPDLILRLMCTRDDYASCSPLSGESEEADEGIGTIDSGNHKRGVTT